jgi:hypothetical protein
VDLEKHLHRNHLHGLVDLERLDRWTLDDLRYLVLLVPRYFLGCLECPGVLLILEDPHRDLLVLLDPRLIRQFLGYLGILEVPEDRQHQVRLELLELLLRWKK